MRPILILALGNPLQSDDGVGCRVAQRLEGCALPGDVEVMDGGTPGVGLLNLLEGRERVIIVDAAEMNRAPGSIARFAPQEARLGVRDQAFSLHHAGVAEALALANELRLALPPITIVAVQPARVEWGGQLSAAVEAALPRVVTEIFEELDRGRLETAPLHSEISLR
jgi:hydrogenase maturation protease